jgi:F-type H+-transporting ATPase subunit epsilon
MKVKVISSSELILEEDNATSVYVPSTEGIIGILPGHANLVSTLQIGLLRIRTKDGRKWAIVLNGGIVQVHKNEVLVLADEASKTDELVKEEVAKAIKDAEEKLSGKLEPQELIRLEKMLRYEKFKEKAAGL